MPTRWIWCWASGNPLPAARARRQLPHATEARHATLSLTREREATRSTAQSQNSEHLKKLGAPIDQKSRPARSPGASKFLRCTEPSQVHRSFSGASKFQWRIEGHSHGRGGGTPRAAQPPAIRFGPYGPSRATLENAFAFPQLRALAGSSPGSGPGRKNGPVAGAITRMVGAVGLEPTIPKAEDFKSPAYANSATPPCASKCTTPRRRRARTEPLRESAEPPRMRTARSTEQQPGSEALTLGTPPRQSGFMGQKARPINPPKLRKKFLNLALPFVSIGIHAGVAELADAYGSGPYGGNPVKVQVLSPAP